MENNKEHISTADTVGKAHLPLYEFFIVLKRNNFLVTPEQISDVNKVIGQYAHNLKSELELCDYLVPIFANSQEEQIRFKQIFEEYFRSQPTNIPEEPEKTKKKIWIYLFILLAAIFGVWILISRNCKGNIEPLQYCSEMAAISIEKSFSADSILIGTQIKLNAVIKEKQPDSISWSSSGQSIFEPNNTIEVATTVNKQGVQTFYCQAFYNSENTPCYVSAEISFTVYDTTPIPKVNFIASANAQPITLPNKVYGYWYVILGILAVLSLFLTTLFARWLHQLKKLNTKVVNDNQNAYDNMINSFSGKTGTSEVPFYDSNYLILPEPEFSEIATQMRKRISDDATYIHIGKTISKVILNGGYFDPVIAARTQQSEFLVLIDKNNNDDQQVKLFDFLMDFLKKQNVYIDTYYFKKSLLHCYNKTKGKEISLEKLSEKYPEHIILIFGNAYQLIYPDYPSIDRYCMQVLNRWQYKAVMTPVSYMDWGNKEKKILLPQLPVFPVDTYGQLIFMRKLFEEDLNILSQLDKSNDHFYDVEMIDFKDIDELLEYCSAVEWANIPSESNYSNILFQWIAALAVYPKIRWELTLKIGHALLDKHGLKQILNFTTLLRLLRISWMKSGKFPDFMRLNLLKHLSVENEIIARETILLTLSEIPLTELNASHFAFEEKETQRIINEFNLYAYDKVKYADYIHSKELFVKLIAKDFITDLPAKTYLENSNLDWITLINKQNQTATPTHKPENITLKEFLEVQPEKSSLKEKVYLWATSLSSLLFVASLLGLVALIFLEISGNYTFVPFTNAPPTIRIIQISYNIDFSGASTSRDISLSIDSSSVKLWDPSKTNENNVSPFSAPIPVLINDSIKRVIINWDKKPVFDTLMDIKYDSYNVIMKASAILDSDNDGILDKDDKCPNEAGTVANNGCPERRKTSKNIDLKLEQKRIDSLKNVQNKKREPIDTDGDGVSDENDRCPRVKGTVANYGCPETKEQDAGNNLNNNQIEQRTSLDSDGDGVLDNVDKCPEVKGTVANNGCPETKEQESKDNLNNNQIEQRTSLDSDGDGVLDNADKCPDVKGTVANNGCPEVTKEVRKTKK